MPAGNGRKGTRAWRRSKYCIEDHRQPIYAVRFCNFGIPYDYYFATVGVNRVTVYKNCPKSEKIECVQAYMDSDKKESFYTVEWLAPQRESGEPLVAAAGVSGVIKIINCAKERLVRALYGHANQSGMRS